MEFLLLYYVVSLFPEIILRVTAQPSPSPPSITTPVIEWSGTQTWATFEQERKECWNHSAMAEVIRSSEPPTMKKTRLNEHGCRMDYGLECREILDTNTQTSKHACRCMLILGGKPAVENPADPSSSDEDKKFGKNAKCYIPAGNGDDSKCFYSSAKDKKILSTFRDTGFPYTFGDPVGLGPDPPKLVDVFNGQTDLEDIVKYVSWNSIKAPCVPLADCIEGASYLDRRCQCLKSATLTRSTGLCNYARKIKPGLLMKIILCSSLLFYSR